MHGSEKVGYCSEKNYIGLWAKQFFCGPEKVIPVKAVMCQHFTVSMPARRHAAH